MKKIALLLIAGFIFFSCGKEKKEVEETKTVKESLKTSLILDAVYIKDDTIKVFYKQDNFFNYDEGIRYSLLTLGIIAYPIAGLCFWYAAKLILPLINEAESK